MVSHQTCKYTFISKYILVWNGRWIYTRLCKHLFFFLFCVGGSDCNTWFNFYINTMKCMSQSGKMLSYIAADTPNKAFEHFRYTTILVTIYEGLPKNTKRTFKHYSRNGITWYMLLVSFNFRKRENLIYISVIVNISVWSGFFSFCFQLKCL